MISSQKNVRESWVTRLVFLNVIVFLLQIIFAKSQTKMLIPVDGMVYSQNIPTMLYYFGLTPSIVISQGYVWQIFSYMFLHSTQSFMHIFFNMYALFLFGAPVEQLWGPKKFIRYYMFTGIGAGILILTMNFFIGGASMFIPTIGASGAVFGLLLAFGLLFPDLELLVFFIIPMKAKFLVIIYGALELYLLIDSGGMGSVSHVGHVGGLLFGIIYFIVQRKNLIKFKAKEMRAKSNRDHRERQETLRNNRVDRKERLFNILMEVRQSGIDSISDDDYQFIRELDIILDPEDADPNFIIEDNDRIAINDNRFESCALAELRKVL